MKLLLLCLVSFLSISLVLPNPVKLEAKKDLKLAQVTPLQCIECELIIQLFHFLNDAIIGGEGEEKARQAVLKACESLPAVAQYQCKALADPKTWDAIFKALRDSLGAFYNLVGVNGLGCPSLKDVQAACG